MHADHLGGTAVETDASGTATTTQSYYAYGKKRGGGAPVTDHRFTGQKLDGTGLMYYQARYYDPAIGAFISPDTMVPGATKVLDYNRFMYVRGRPLNHTDSSGHCIDGISTWFCIGAVLAGAAFLLQGDDPAYQPTQADINSQRLGGALMLAGGTGSIASKLACSRRPWSAHGRNRLRRSDLACLPAPFKHTPIQTRRLTGGSTSPNTITN